MSERGQLSPAEIDDKIARSQAQQWKEGDHKKKMSEEIRSAVPTADESMVVEYIRERLNRQFPKIRKIRKLPKTSE
jgi:pheromone shutdown protein TraB